jgi:hypothetical protein
MTLFKVPSGSHYVLETGMRIGPVAGKGFEIVGMGGSEWCEYASESEAQIAWTSLVSTIISDDVEDAVKPTRGRPRKAE